MTRWPNDVLARLRAKARQEREREEERSGERSKPALPISPEQRQAWLASGSLRPPSEGSTDVVKLRRRRR